MKKTKLLPIIISLLLSACLVTSCTSDTPDTGSETTSTVQSGNSENNNGTSGNGDQTDNGDNDNGTESDFSATLSFNGSSCDISDSEAVVKNGKTYKIVKAGTYTLKGNMDDGQIQVEVADTERVTLVLDNFDGKCNDSAVIYVINADKVYIDLEKGTVNSLTDATSYVYSDPSETKPNACIYSADDLTIKGSGRLNIFANYNNGIGCKNDVVIKNGDINISAVNNAIKGNYSVTIKGDAKVNISAAEDGIKADTTKKADKGFIEITEQAQVTVTCTDDALQATQNVTITENAKVTVIAAATPVNCDGTTNIADNTLIIQ